MARLLEFPEFSNWMTEWSAGPVKRLTSGCIPLEDDERRDGRSIHNNHGGHDDQNKL